MKKENLVPSDLSASARKALLQLLHDEQSSGFERNAFPGAVGRHGAVLGRRGYARRIGRTVYRGNRRGELPDAYVEFRLTDAGRALAKLMQEKLA